MWAKGYPLIRAIRVYGRGIFVGFWQLFSVFYHTGYFDRKGIGYKSILLKQNLIRGSLCYKYISNKAQHEYTGIA